MVFAQAEFVEKIHYEASQQYESYAVEDAPYFRVSLLRSIRLCLFICLENDVDSVVNLLLVSVLHDVDYLPDPVIRTHSVCRKMTL